MSIGKSALTAATLAAVASIFTSLPAESQSYRFDRKDERGNIAGKRASCEVYARIAQVQINANISNKCGFTGPRWTRDPQPHFRWCRFAPRSKIGEEQRERARELQQCFDRLGDFDDDRR